jgi:hypothetical protein
MLRELGLSPEQVQANREEAVSRAEPPAGASEPQSAKRVRLKDWLPGAVERWPRDKANTDDYPEFLRQRAPKAWTKHYIQTELSALTKEKPTKKS